MRVVEEGSAQDETNIAATTVGHNHGRGGKDARRVGPNVFGKHRAQAVHTPDDGGEINLYA